MTKSEYPQDKRSVIGWIAGILGVLLTGAVSFLGTQLMAHETAISVLKEKAHVGENRLERMDAKLDKILDELYKKP